MGESGIHTLLSNVSGTTLTFAVLYGQHELTIDSKHRILVPADVRKCLVPERDGAAFFILTGDNGRIWLYPEKIYEAMGADIRRSFSPGEDQLDFYHSHYSLADRLEWDNQGRILLPEMLLRETETGKDVILTGAFDHLEIWNKEQWIEHRKVLREKRSEISLRAQQRSQISG